MAQFVTKNLPELPADKAVNLLYSICSTSIPPVDIEPGVAERVCRYCGYLPFAIRAAGNYLTTIPSQPPAEFAQQLEVEHRRLETLDRDEDDGPIGIEASFNVSYSQLPEPTAKVFRSLGVFTASFETSAEAAICEDPDNQHLRTLVRKALVSDEPGSGRFVLHDLLRLFAIKRSGEDQNSICKKHAEYFVTVLEQLEKLFDQEESLLRAAELFTAEKVNILAAWRRVGEQGNQDKESALLCCRFATTGQGLLDGYLHPDVRELLYDLSVKAARALGPSKLASESEASALRRLAQALHDSGRKRNQAIQLLTESVEISKAIGDRQREQAALVLLGRSQMQADESDKAKQELALKNLLKACELAKDIDSSLEMHALGYLGSGYSKFGKPKDARACFEKQLRLACELRKPRAEANALNGLGMLAFHADADKSQAIALLEQAKAQAQGLRDLKAENMAAEFLGKAYAKMGRFNEALSNYRISQSLNHDLGNRKKEGVAWAAIGGVQIDLRDWVGAEESFHRALDIARHAKNPRGEFHALKELAHLFSNNQPKRAIAFAEAAISIDRNS